MEQGNPAIKKNIANHLPAPITFISRVQKTRGRPKTLSRQNHGLRPLSSSTYDLSRRETPVQDVSSRVSTAITIILQGLKNLGEFDWTPISEKGTSNMDFLLKRGRREPGHSNSSVTWFYQFLVGALQKMNFSSGGVLAQGDLTKPPIKETKSYRLRAARLVDMTCDIVRALHSEAGWGPRAFLLYHALAGMSERDAIFFD